MSYNIGRIKLMIFLLTDAGKKIPKKAFLVITTQNLYRLNIFLKQKKTTSECEIRFAGSGHLWMMPDGSIERKKNEIKHYVNNDILSARQIVEENM
jgi:hypothetical protein